MNLSLSNKVTWLLVAVLGLSLLTVGGYAESQRSDTVDFIKEHIETSGGRFWVECEQGMDVAFHFTLSDEENETSQEETERAHP